MTADRQEGLASVPNWRFLTGTRRQLEQDGDGEQNEQCPAAPLEVMRRQDA